MDPSSTLAGWISDTYSYGDRNSSKASSNKAVCCDEWCFSFNSKDCCKQNCLNQKCYMTEEEEAVMIMGSVVDISNKSHCPNLMQNCDLPPPVKIFTSADKTLLNSIRSKHVISNINQEEGKNEMSIGRNTDESDKLELMKALQLSQSRARTAEKKASFLAAERDRLSTLFLSDSLLLFAHRQWVKLLQLEITQLQSQKLKKAQEVCSNCSNRHERNKGSSEADNGENVGSLGWCMTLALCLGIASVGVAVGYRYCLF
ncbi:hypothetical protein FRX31_005663 [Thalictrum thalictroides]|uniref:Transmembrane protein n=1 Tax=Thalictrum thalictroides TaxID=46969 RepID=A0A7J6X6Q0_THATH|nr:hypothetical protein FRX31_005663 [Thalictrum thalictroides]